jgi:hypothetical protein
MPLAIISFGRFAALPEAGVLGRGRKGATVDLVLNFNLDVMARVFPSRPVCGLKQV